MARYYYPEYVTRNCEYCTAIYKADKRNLDRGWGLCCCKSCAAKLRERNKRKADKISQNFNKHLGLQGEWISSVIIDEAVELQDTENITFDNWEDFSEYFVAR